MRCSLKSIGMLMVLLGLCCQFSLAQNQGGLYKNELSTKRVFSNLQELLDYTAPRNIGLQNNELRLEQARKAKLAAVLGVIDLNGNLLSAQFTDNTTLGVNLFPAEVFGGEPGTFQEVQTGVRYNTNLTNYAEIKLVNPQGWANLKLSKINIDLTQSNNLISLKNLQENIANNYFNIVNLKEQIVSSKQNLAVADTLYQITQNKFQEGLVKQQDVNDSRVNYLNTEESINQLAFLLEQYYLSLKILCDIPEEEPVEIDHGFQGPSITGPEVFLNELGLNNALLQERYALANLKSMKAAFLPTLSFQASNSFNLYNTEFAPLSGDWITSNYLGLRLSVPIPHSQNISQKYNAEYEFKIAQRNSEQARIEASLDQKRLESEFQQSLSQVQANEEILSLRKDSYFKNKNLYQEGLLSLENTINSFNSMVNAQFNLISSKADLQLAEAKISINNNIR